MIRSIERTESSVRIVDQTRLPGTLVYRTIEDYRELLDAIRTLAIRGAPAIGIAAAYGIAFAAQQTHDHSLENITRIAHAFEATRPTAVNLFWAAERMLDCAREAADQTFEATLDVLWSEAEAIHHEDERMCRQIGENGAKLVPQTATVLTHCNAGALATGGIGTALGVLYVCHEQGKKLRVYADETRPLLQGARLTAWELSQAGIAVTLICDSVAGSLMRTTGVDCVIVGADRIAANGDTANKIGTYSLAVLAARHGVPFYVAAPASTFDATLASGAQIKIEERAPEEVTEGFGKRTAPEGVAVYSPAFDVTPNELINAFVTDTGIRPGGRPHDDQTV